jgi:adenine specific DNA methylase Mod
VSPRSLRLTWPDRPAAFARVHEGPALARAERPRRFATACGRGAFFDGDNLASLDELLRTHEGRVDLAYMDPPFDTGRVFETQGRLAAEGASVAYEDRWSDRAAYLEALAARLTRVRDLLAPHGSVVVHVDPRTSHYVKVLLDELFGEENFASEIVWRYRRWPSKTRNFQRVHDVMLRYRKDARVEGRWNALYEDLAPSTKATWGTRKQRAVVDADGRRLRSSTVEEESKGVPMGDVWDIGVVAPVAKERTGYPSQKPEALLGRIVSALSNEGDLVLDPYAGSGTTAAVAWKLNRRFVTMDMGEASREVVRTRLGALGAALEPVAEQEKTGHDRKFAAA